MLADQKKSDSSNNNINNMSKTIPNRPHSKYSASLAKKINLSYVDELDHNKASSSQRHVSKSNNSTKKNKTSFSISSYKKSVRFIDKSIFLMSPSFEMDEIENELILKQQQQANQQLIAPDKSIDTGGGSEISNNNNINSNDFHELSIENDQFLSSSLPSDNSNNYLSSSLPNSGIFRNFVRFFRHNNSNKNKQNNTPNTSLISNNNNSSCADKDNEEQITAASSSIDLAYSSNQKLNYCC